MKKIVIVSLYIFLILLPITVLAEEPLQAMNLEGLLKDEEIEADLSNYKETDEQITIYLFRGHGCNHCYDFAEFLGAIVDEYGSYFKVVSFETWYDEQNAELLKRVAKFVGKKEAVPLIVIGSESFSGFGVDTEEDIKNAIMKEYNSKDKYDVLVEMEKEQEEPVSFSVILLGFGAILVLCILLFSYLHAKSYIDSNLTE